MGIFLLGFFGLAIVDNFFNQLLRALEFLEEIFLPTRLSWSFFILISKKDCPWRQSFLKCFIYCSLVLVEIAVLLVVGVVVVSGLIVAGVLLAPTKQTACQGM